MTSLFRPKRRESFPGLAGALHTSWRSDTFLMPCAGVQLASPPLRKLEGSEQAAERYTPKLKVSLQANATPAPTKLPQPHTFQSPDFTSVPNWSCTFWKPAEHFVSKFSRPHIPLTSSLLRQPFLCPTAQCSFKGWETTLEMNKSRLRKDELDFRPNCRSR